MNNVTVSIILPTYNEKGNIVALIRAIHKNLLSYPHEIVVVDDDSPDLTWKVAQNLSLPYVSVIHRIRQRGLASALRTGIEKAKGEWVGWMDADFSHPPSVLKKMMRQRSTCDAIIASRYTREGKDIRRERVQVIASAILNDVLSFLFGTTITDYTSGYILVKKSLITNYRLEGAYGEYFIYLSEYLMTSRARICEVPVRVASRIWGQSKTIPSVRVFAGHGLTYCIAVAKLALRKWLR
jgi:dolichol-phosphate mannosyltransferase